MKGKKKAPVRGRTDAKGTQGHNPLQTHTARRKVNRASIVYHKLKGKSRGYENEYGLFDRMDGRRVVQRARNSEKRRKRAGSRHGGSRSLEQREGLTMAKIIRTLGIVILSVSVVAILGTAGAEDHGGLSYVASWIQSGIFLAAAGIGGFMIKIGGRLS